MTKSWEKAVNWLSKNVSVLAILVVIVWVTVINYSNHPWMFEDKVIAWDVISYYSYLPSLFIHHDLTMGFLETNPELYGKLWPVKIENGNYMILTSYGLSLLYSPFFLIAHLYASLSGYEADGFSVPYRYALTFSSLFYVVIGLLFLRKTLRLYFRDFISGIVILAVTIGTNLLHYTTHEAPMSHAYNFALIAVFSFLTVKWHEKPRWQNTVVIGLLFGLIALARPTNVIVILFFIFWSVTSFDLMKERILFFFRRFDLVLLMIFCFLLVWFPQFLYWKTITGHWIYYTYGAKEGSFFFSNPQILNILFSYQKGWFVYTPIMFVAFIGIFFMIRRLKIAFWPVLIYMVVMIYVLSSWWSWWFGGGFGLRAFVDTYAIMAIPLATWLDVSLKRKWLAGMSVTLIAVLIWFNTFQNRQYMNGAIHWLWMNKDAYWASFLKLHPPKGFYDLLTRPDYDKAAEGIYEEISFPEFERRARVKTLKAEFRKYVMKNDRIMSSLEQGTSDKASLDERINEYTEKNLGYYILLSRPNIVDSLKQTVLEDSSLMMQIRQEAGENYITVDSILNRRAIHLYKYEVLKY